MWAFRCQPRARDAAERVDGAKPKGQGHPNQPPVSAYEADARAAPAEPADTRGEPQGEPANVKRARSMWTATLPIPRAADHPARRWVAEGAAKSGCWSAFRDWPRSIRWLRGNVGAGALVAAVAPLDAWLASWPEPPEPTGVQLIYLSADGWPVKDGKGRSKVSHGALSGAGMLIGMDPLQGPVYCCEGVADALAVATWVDGPSREVVPWTGTATAFAGMGTSGLAHPDTAKVLAALPQGCVAVSDNDAAGALAAVKLCKAVKAAGGRGSRVGASTGV